MADEAFNRIVRVHGPAFSRLARGYVDDAADHDDLLQEILIAVWKALPRFRGEASERTFVFRIAHNRAITFAGKARRQVARTTELRTDQPADAAPVDGDSSEELRRAVRKLPTGQRQVVMLYLEGLSPAEIAAVQGITENNANVRLTRARQALRELLGGDNR